MSKALLTIVALLLSAGCAKSPAPLAPQAAIKDQSPVIVRLVSRDRTVTISKGPAGPVYSVHDLKGKTLLSLASREQLRLHHPDLSHMLDSAIATSADPTLASVRTFDAHQAPATFTMPALNQSGPLMLHGE